MCKYLNKNIIKINKKLLFSQLVTGANASLTFHLQDSADKVSHDIHSFCQEAIHLLNSTLKTNKKPTVNSVSRFYKIYLCSSFTDLHVSGLLHLGYMQKLSIICMMSVLLPQISSN